MRWDASKSYCCNRSDNLINIKSVYPTTVFIISSPHPLHPKVSQIYLKEDIRGIKSNLKADHLSRIIERKPDRCLFFRCKKPWSRRVLKRLHTSCCMHSWSETTGLPRPIVKPLVPSGILGPGTGLLIYSLPEPDAILPCPVYKQKKDYIHSKTQLCQ